MAAHIVVGLALHALVVDGENDVASPQPHLGGGHSRVGFPDDRAVELVVVVDDGPDARILARNHLLEVLLVLLREELRVGVHGGEHGVDAHWDDGVGVERVHIHGVEIAVDIVEELKVLRYFEVVLFLCLCRQRQCEQ